MVYLRSSPLALLLKVFPNLFQLLFGHPSEPVDDASYQLLGGRGYCLGGPALILSQGLLAGEVLINAVHWLKISKVWGERVGRVNSLVSVLF